MGGVSLVMDLCNDHAVPFEYEETFEHVEPEPIPGPLTAAKAVEIARLRREAGLRRAEYALDRRRTRLLEEERDLLGRADDLLEELKAELGVES